MVQTILGHRQETHTGKVDAITNVKTATRVRVRSTHVCDSFLEVYNAAVTKPLVNMTSVLQK